MTDLHVRLVIPEDTPASSAVDRAVGAAVRDLRALAGITVDPDRLRLDGWTSAVLAGPPGGQHVEILAAFTVRDRRD